jgi:hypothetical protein
MDNPKQTKTKTVNPSLTVDGDDQGDHPDIVASLKVEHEESKNKVHVVSPDTTRLSAIHKLVVEDLWSDDKEGVEQALTQLANLCFPSYVNWTQENTAAIHSAGAASAIVGAMKKWYTVPDIQVEGCRALAYIAADIKDFRLSAENAGGLEVIVCAMQNYLNNSEVQAMRCAALGFLCLDIEKHAAHVVNTMKGHGIIIAAMKTFPENARVQRYACHALSKLSFWKEFRMSICDAGGRRALAEALETHNDESKEDPDDIQNIQKLARLVLQRLLE